MTLILEDGTGTNPNANSFVTVADVTAYHAEFGNLGTEWTAVGAEQEKACMVTSLFVSLAFDYYGSLLVDGQPFAWPRQDAEDPTGFALLGIPVAVKQAVCEGAPNYLTLFSASESEPGVQESEIKVDVITIKKKFVAPDTSAIEYPKIAQLLKNVTYPSDGIFRG